MSEIRLGFGITALLKTSLFGGVDGIGHVSLGLLSSLKKIDQMDVIPFAFSRESYARVDNYGTSDLGNFKFQLLRNILFNLHFNEDRLVDERIEVFHSVDHYIPSLKKIPVLATIHDAIPFYNEFVPARYRLVSAAFSKSIAFADKIIVPSFHSKSELVRVLGIREYNIEVIYNGISDVWFDEYEPQLISNARAKYGLVKDYILSVGTLQPRKNIEGTITAYLSLPERVRRDYELVIIGKAGSNSEKQVRLLSRCVEQNLGIRWLGYVSDSEVCSLLRGASCLCHPSFLEGFGLPVVEAFATGVPVVTSNTSSLVEIAGSGALCVDPRSTTSISNAILEILTKPDVRSELTSIGKSIALKYTWDEASSRYHRAYRSLV